MEDNIFEEWLQDVKNHIEGGTLEDLYKGASIYTWGNPKHLRSYITVDFSTCINKKRRQVMTKVDDQHYYIMEELCIPIPLGVERDKYIKALKVLFCGE
jgi:hypothetical protein